METRSDENPNILVADESGDIISSAICVRPMNTPNEIWDKRVHIIAAAPQMLKALESLMEGIRLKGDDEMSFHNISRILDGVCEAKAAIAKARGEI